MQHLLWVHGGLHNFIVSLNIILQCIDVRMYKRVTGFTGSCQCQLLRREDALLCCGFFLLCPDTIAPTCLAMSPWVETEFSQVWNCSRLFYQQCVPYFQMKYYSRQESKETIRWAFIINRYISAIIPTQAEVTESRIWWHHRCCLR